MEAGIRGGSCILNLTYFTPLLSDTKRRIYLHAENECCRPVFFCYKRFRCKWLMVRCDCFECLFCEEQLEVERKILLIYTLILFLKSSRSI